MPTRPTIVTVCDPPSSACRGHRPSVPLLALAPPALALGEEILGMGDEETNVRDFWNVISKASDIVKDGERLENLAWRQWCQHRRDSTHSSSSQSSNNRRISFSSSGTTASSISLPTPFLDQPPSPTISVSSRHSDRRTFGSALRLLMDEDNFKDWVSDAQRNFPPPTISVPDTPVANLEIRLVEPTPVPSRVGSLGGSMGGAGLMGGGGLLGVAVPPRLTEEPEVVEVVEEEEEDDDDEEYERVEQGYLRPIRNVRGKGVSRSPRKKGKFFVHSSPSKGSGSDTAASPGPAPQFPNIPQTPSSPQPQALSPSHNLSPAPPPHHTKHHRQSSGSSIGAAGPSTIPPSKKRSPATKRHVSLSTMRGRFGVEKRKAAELLAQKAKEEAEAEVAAARDEDSGWEDDVEEDEEEEEEEEDEDDYEDEEDEEAEDPGPHAAELAGSVQLKEVQAVRDVKEETEVKEEDEDWSDEASDSEPPPSRQILQAPSPIKQPAKPPAHPYNPAPPMRRTSSNRSAKSNANNKSASASTLDLAALLSATSSRKTFTSDGPPPPPAPTPLRNMSRKQRLAAAEERKRIEAELEAQKKREMFAKQQIFGARPTQGEGLLSGIFRQGGSMVNLTAAIPQLMSPPLRPSPTHGHLPSLSKSPIGPTLLRSKSAVAVPVQTGVSVSRVLPKRSKLNEEIGSGGSRESLERQRDIRRGSRTSDRSDKTGSNERRPPAGIVLESDDSSSEDDDYLATSSTKRKLAELATKWTQRGKGRQSTDTLAGMDAGPAMPVPTVQQIMQNGQMAVRFDVPAAVQQPMTPTTRRRTIISREMSESLRRNLILERQKSSGGGARRTSVGPAPHTRPPPITHTSHFPARNSSTNLAQYQMGVPLARHRSETALPRQNADSQLPMQLPFAFSGHQHGGSSSPVPPQPHRSATTGSVITIQTMNRPQQNYGQQPPPWHQPVPQPQPQVQVEAPRRKPQPNLLGGFLRPLTRVGTGGEAAINRTQSSANLSTTARITASRSVSPTAMEAPAMVRRSTEGSPVADWKVEVDRRREKARRKAGVDTSYRMHGW